MPPEQRQVDRVGCRSRRRGVWRSFFCEGLRRRATQRNEAAIEEWKSRQWPQIKKNTSVGRLSRIRRRKRLSAHPYGPTDMGCERQDTLVASHPHTPETFTHLYSMIVKDPARLGGLVSLRIKQPSRQSRQFFRSSSAAPSKFPDNGFPTIRPRAQCEKHSSFGRPKERGGDRVIPWSAHQGDRFNEASFCYNMAISRKRLRYTPAHFSQLKNSPAPELWTRCPQLWLPALFTRPWVNNAGFIKQPLRTSPIASVQLEELNGPGYSFEVRALFSQHAVGR